MRGAVFTARFPASLIVFSASGLTLMLRPAPVRPFFALACPVWADVPPFPVSPSKGAVTASLCFLFIGFHCQLLSATIGCKNAFFPSPLFHSFYPVSSIFYRGFLSRFSSDLICHDAGLFFCLQHRRTHQFFRKPGGRIADLWTLIPHFFFDIFQSHTSHLLYFLTFPSPLF